MTPDERLHILALDELSPEQEADVRAHVRGLTCAEGEPYVPPEHGWTCFHCGETFRTVKGARLHFGDEPRPSGRPPSAREIDVEGLAKAALAGIAAIDEASKRCPVGQSSRYIEVCPNCGATDRGPCREKVAALGKLEQDLRAIILPREDGA